MALFLIIEGAICRLTVNIQRCLRLTHCIFAAITALLLKAIFPAGNFVKIFPADCADILQRIYHAIYSSRSDTAVFLQGFVINFLAAATFFFQNNI